MIELTDKEKRLIWEMCNYHQHLGMERISNLCVKLSKTDKIQPILDNWVAESIDEHQELEMIKAKMTNGK